MAFQKYIHNDPLYVRLGSLLDELDAKLDRALYSKGKVRLFLSAQNEDRPIENKVLDPNEWWESLSDEEKATYANK